MGVADIDKTDWDQPDRWAIMVPWKPEIPDDDRVIFARQWLEFLGLDVTEKRIKNIKRHVMLYHPLSPRGQVANELVRQDDKSPSRMNVERTYTIVGVSFRGDVRVESKGIWGSRLIHSRGPHRQLQIHHAMDITTSICSSR